MTQRLLSGRTAAPIGQTINEVAYAIQAGHYNIGLSLLRLRTKGMAAPLHGILGQ